MSKPAYNIPNMLTYGRIIAVPLVVLCFFLEGRLASSEPARWAAFTIFIVASVTDFLDGYLARLWKQSSNIGRMLDPIADKLLVSAVLLLLAADGTIAGWSLWAAIIILCREILVSGLREYLAALKVSVPVTQLAKWKTTLQLIAIGFLLAGPAADNYVDYMTETGIALLWASAIITLYTGWDYFRAGLKHIGD
jgi:cardiolipin synthase